MLPVHHNPRYTIKLLEVLNLTEADFQSIHHRGEVANIEDHIAYCRKTKAFKENGTNAATAKRLEDELINRLRSSVA